MCVLVKKLVLIAITIRRSRPDRAARRQLMTCANDPKNYRKANATFLTANPLTVSLFLI